MILITLEQALQSIPPDPGGVPLGKGDGKRKVTAALQKAQRHNLVWFVLTVSMTLGLLVATVVAVLLNLNQPDTIRALNLAFGLPAGALVYLMVRLWREKSRMDLLIVLIDILDDQAIQKIVNWLIDSKANEPLPALQR